MNFGNRHSGKTWAWNTWNCLKITLKLIYFLFNEGFKVYIYIRGKPGNMDSTPLPLMSKNRQSEFWTFLFFGLFVTFFFLLALLKTQNLNSNLKCGTSSPACFKFLEIIQEVLYFYCKSNNISSTRLGL